MYRNAIVALLLVGISYGGNILYDKYQLKRLNVSIMNEIELFNLRNGDILELSEILKNKGTLIYYTSTTCSVCVKQRQMFKSLEASTKGNIQWLDIVADTKNITQWVDKYGAMHDWVTLDPKRQFAHRFKLIATPVILLVNERQEVVFYHRGYLSIDQWIQDVYPLILDFSF